MKNKIYIASLICILFTFVSCDKFLDVKPANQLVVVSPAMPKLLHVCNQTY